MGAAPLTLALVGSPTVYRLDSAPFLFLLWQFEFGQGVEWNRVRVLSSAQCTHFPSVMSAWWNASQSSPRRLLQRGRLQTTTPQWQRA